MTFPASSAAAQVAVLVGQIPKKLGADGADNGASEVASLWTMRVVVKTLWTSRREGTISSELVMVTGSDWSHIALIVVVVEATIGAVCRVVFAMATLRWRLASECLLRLQELSMAPLNSTS